MKLPNFSAVAMCFNDSNILPCIYNTLDLKLGQGVSFLEAPPWRSAFTLLMRSIAECFGNCKQNLREGMRYFGLWLYLAGHLFFNNSFYKGIRNGYYS